jgi:hypothetical protein
MVQIRTAIVSPSEQPNATIPNTLPQYLVLLAALSPWLYDRYLGLSTMLANRPGKIQYVNNFKSMEIECTECVRNCEDVILEEELGLAILSCDPGRDRWNTVMVCTVINIENPQSSSNRRSAIPTGSPTNMVFRRALSTPPPPPHPSPTTTAPSTSTTTPRPISQPPTPSTLSASPIGAKGRGTSIP